MPRSREPIAERLGRPHTPKAGLQAGSVCDKKKVPAQLELRGRESLEQRTSPLMNHDSTRATSRKVEPDLSRYANARIPIQQAASWLGVEITKGKFLCPSHDDHDPSASVNPDGIHWKCFPCGAGGSAIDLVMAVRQCDRDTAVNEIVGGYSGPTNGHAKASTAKPKTGVGTLLRFKPRAISVLVVLSMHVLGGFVDNCSDCHPRSARRPALEGWLHRDAHPPKIDRCL